MNPIDFIFLPHGFSDIFDVLFQQAFGSLLGVGKPANRCQAPK